MSCPRQQQDRFSVVFCKHAKEMRKLIDEYCEHEGAFVDIEVPRSKIPGGPHEYLRDGVKEHVYAASEALRKMHLICGRYGINVVYKDIRALIAPVNQDMKEVLADCAGIGVSPEDHREAVFDFVMKVVPKKG